MPVALEKRTVTGTVPWLEMNRAGQSRRVRRGLEAAFRDDALGMVDTLARMLAEKGLEGVDDLLLDRRFLRRSSRRNPDGDGGEAQAISEIVATGWRMTDSQEVDVEAEHPLVSATMLPAPPCSGNSQRSDRGKNEQE